MDTAPNQAGPPPDPTTTATTQQNSTANTTTMKTTAATQPPLPSPSITTPPPPPPPTTPTTTTSAKTGELFNFFVVVTGETGGAHDELIRNNMGVGQTQKESVEESDYILAFCPSPSRTGTDVKEAMGKIPSGKPVILVVMHHTNDVEARLGDSSRHVTRTDVILTVDTLFWEGEFLNCSHNEKAYSKVLEAVGKSSWKATLNYFRNIFGTRARQLFNFFVFHTGVTGGAHEKFIRKLEHFGQIRKESVEDSDYILAFCPSPSRTGTDVQEAMGKIPSGKPVILVVMHHRHDVPASLDDSSKHVTRDDVILTVDTLFWEGEFLNCSHNEEAFNNVLEAVGQSTSCCFFVERPYAPLTPSQDTASSSNESHSSGTPCISVIYQPSPEFGNKDTLLNFVKKCELENDSMIEQVRILLLGPVGSGKSSFINSVSSILKGRMTHGAHVDTVAGDAICTKKYKTYKIEGNTQNFFPTVFNDMGLGSETGVHEDDIILALKGHIKDGYEFNLESAMTVKHSGSKHEDNDPHYIHNPTTEDKIHVLVFVIPADQVSILSTAVIEKMERIRYEAQGLGIPQICIFTMIDKACNSVKNDVKYVYKSEYVKKKMEEVSAKVDIPMDHIFPVKNYHEETDLDDDVDVLILKALQCMLFSGTNFIKKMVQYNQSNSKS